MEKVRCPICGKRTDNTCYCKHCGMYVTKDHHINNCFELVDKYLKNNNLDIKYYSRTEEEHYKVSQSGLRKVINSIQAYKNIAPIELIDALIRIESVQYKRKYQNITQNMAQIFGYLLWNFPGMDPFYNYWYKRAVKEGYREQIEWAISDYEHGIGVKANPRKANKLKKLLRTTKGS